MLMEEIWMVTSQTSYRHEWHSILEFRLLWHALLARTTDLVTLWQLHYVQCFDLLQCGKEICVNQPSVRAAYDNVIQCRCVALQAPILQETQNTARLSASFMYLSIFVVQINALECFVYLIHDFGCQGMAK